MKNTSESPIKWSLWSPKQSSNCSGEHFQRSHCRNAPQPSPELPGCSQLAAPGRQHVPHDERASKDLRHHVSWFSCSRSPPCSDLLPCIWQDMSSPVTSDTESSVSCKDPEDIPTFDEWKRKVMEVEKEKSECVLLQSD